MISIDHQDQHLAALRSGLSVVIFPVQYAVSTPIKALGALSNRIRSHQELVANNERLRQQNLILLSRTQRYSALQQENVRLRRLLESSSEFGAAVVGADVLAIETLPSARQIVIDKGSRHGAFVGQPIVDAYGVFGQIIQTSPFTSTALLITDIEHAAPVQINRTGLRAISVGAGEIDQLELSFIPTNADIKVGDLVVTSGLGGIFPAGYPVGKVTTVDIDHSEPFARIAVSPSAQVSRAREVLLVWPEPKGDEIQQVSATGQDLVP